MSHAAGAFLALCSTPPRPHAGGVKAILFCALAALPLRADEAPAIEPPTCCTDNSRSAILASTFAPLSDETAWSYTDDAAWKWSGSGNKRTLSLTAQARTPPKFRSPFNLAWFDAREWKDFTFTAELRLTKFDAGNNDLCIAFGREAENRFYYVHLGEKADEPHHQIHIVDNADRKPITTFRTGGTPWREGKWHRVKLVRNSATGDIGVWFDDMEKPVLAAKDKTLGWGRIGLGSFDDLGEFRNVSIRGTSRSAK